MPLIRENFSVLIVKLRRFIVEPAIPTMMMTTTKKTVHSVVILYHVNLVINQNVQSVVETIDVNDVTTIIKHSFFILVSLDMNIANEIHTNLPTAIRDHIIHDFIYVVCSFNSTHKINEVEFVTYIDSKGNKYHFCTATEQVNWLLKRDDVKLVDLTCIRCNNDQIICDWCDENENHCSNCGCDDDELLCADCRNPRDSDDD